MPTFAGSFSGRANWQTTVSLKDVPHHEMNVAEIAGPQRSTDPAWNDARITYWGVADLNAGTGTQRGYWVNERANGERDWGTFEGRITTAGQNVTLEGTWAFAGGTGRFSGITGKGTYKGRMTSPMDVEMSWEGAYQLVVAAA